MNANLRNLAIAAAFALPVILVGCRSGYDVNLRNLTDQPIQAKLVTPHTDGADQTLRTTRLGPGDRGDLFVQTDSNQPVALEVDYAGNLGHPARFDLSRGKTIINITRTDQPPAAPGPRLRLEEAPR